MSCKECGKLVADEYGYCPFCGTARGVTFAQSLDNENSDLRRLAELAITERVFFKVVKWLTVLATVLGAALTIFVVAITILGFHLNDIRQDAVKQVETRTTAAIGEITDAENRSRSIVEKLKTVQKNLGEAQTVVAKVRKLRSDVNSLQSQVEGFYKTQIREVFGGPRNEGRYSGSAGKWVVVLKEEPIQASLTVMCGALPENNYQLVGGINLTVNCSLDLKNGDDAIVVVYHSRN